jgi:nitroreductase
MISDLIKKCRTYRKFDESRRIEERILMSFIHNASLAPSGANLQPLKYRIVNDAENNSGLFGCLKWAGYLKNWDGPQEGQRPVSYILILGDLDISKDFSVDLGICAYAITLSAAQKGIGSCMIGSVDRDHVRQLFDIPAKYEILLVIAFGYPAETVVLEKAVGGEIKYYRDEKQVHHVPKRDLADIILE